MSGLKLFPFVHVTFMPIAHPQRLSLTKLNIPLRWVLVVPFVVQTVGAVTLVGYLSFRSGQRVVEDLAHQLMTEVGNRTTLYLDKTLEIPHLVNQLNADAISLGMIPNFQTENTETLEKFFGKQISRFPSVSTIAIANERGGMIGSAQKKPLPSFTVYRTERFSKGKFSFSDVDTQGNKITNQVIAENYDARIRPWYQTPKQAGKATWSPIYKFVTPKNLTILGISAGLPIYNRSGKFQGILATDISLYHLNQFLSTLRISPSGQVFMIERSGLLIASSTDYPLFTLQGGKLQRTKAAESKNPIIRETTLQLIKRFRSLSQINNTEQFDIEQNNATQFVQVIPFRDRFGLDWLIVIVVPESDFTAEIQANNYRTALLCGLALMGSILLGLWTARKITKPIQKLNLCTQAFSAGKPVSLLTPTGIQEVDALRDGFNQMMTQLNASFQALQENQQTLKTFLDSVPVGMSVHAPSGQVIFVNNKGKEILTPGVTSTPAEQLSQVYQLYLAGTNEFYPTEKLPAIRGLQGESVYIDDMEIEVNGRRVPIEVNTIPVFDKNGNVLYAIDAFQDITERRQSEQLRTNYQRELESQVAEQTTALRESKAQLQLITDSVPGCISYIDASQRYRFVNKTYEAWFNCQKEDILGKTIQQVIGLEAYQQVLPYITQVLVGKTVTYETQVPYQGNHTRDISAVLVPDMDEHQIVHGYYALITDISEQQAALRERKRTEAALRESEARFQQLAANVPGIIYTIVHSPDGSTRLEYISAAVEEILEIKPEQALADFSLIAKQWHPEDVEAYSLAIRQNLTTFEPFSYEWRVITPSGKLKWLIAKRSALERRDNGDIVGYGIVKDISDRKRAEAALRESEARFRLAFDDAAIGMALLALDGQFMEVNQALCDLVGYSETELLQKTCWAITHPEDFPAIEENVQQLLSGEQRSFQMKKRCIHKQGKVIWTMQSTSAIRDQNGVPLYCVSQIQDISDRQVAERVKDEFISVVSHELRTPLTSICGALGILQSGKFDNHSEKFQHFLQIAVNNSIRLVRLINDILDLERLESDSVELLIEECEASELMKQAVEAVQTLASQASITIQVVPISVNLWASSGAIVQVITNLLSNALKFSPPGSTIWLKAELVNDEPNLSSNVYLRFSVQDEGRGIPADKLESIFERFQQVDASDSRQKGGTGLGLAICKSIVQKHKGEIWVDSVLGKGSTFYFTIVRSRKDL
ncbi:PAS domain S-box protein [Phormidium sp. LEGE 05292]|uniref:PAS domain S-box protein n=1 Tax=[Phormidium] sp. LEGE 05292 TaxID=767427 RepID=UPI0018821A12|nr:PAS domain S-box protein [Phormidium sp. LEGE 05292]MBE9225529.1 PAS domain S-box protein [Phormidium sp. LEGE 05292]